MASLTVAVLVCSVILLTAEAGGHGQGQQQEGGWQMQRQGQGRQGGQPQGGSMARGARGGWQGQDDDQVGQQRQGGWGNDQARSGGQQGRNSNTRYTANIYNDDDVYGYDAKYPNGEALYVNYRNSEARSRRGPDFARSNSISSRSRMGEMGQTGQGGNSRRQRGSDTEGQHPMW